MEPGAVVPIRGNQNYLLLVLPDLAQSLRKIREDKEQVILVAPYWPNPTWFSELVPLVTAPPWPIPLRKDLLSQGRGTLWHPRPDLWNLHVAPGRDEVGLSTLPPAVVATITSARASRDMSMR